MLVNKAFKYRIYPEKEQLPLLKQCGGNTRFLWNYFWNTQQDYHTEYKQYLSAYDLNYFLPILKKAEGFEFLSRSFSQSLCQVSADLKKAIDRAFDPDTVKQRKQAIAKAMSEPDEEKKMKLLAKAYRLGFPNFHKKDELTDSFRISTRFKIKKSRLYIPQVGWIPYVRHHQYEGIAKNITISQDGEQWYASICCEMNVEEQDIHTDNVIGIDVGLKVFAAFSDGTVIENPKIYRNAENKLKREQRILSRRVKGSKRRLKQQIKVHRIHRTIKNKRKDFLHKLTSSMIAKYDGFVLEDLATKNMVKNHKLAKSIHDASWSKFGRMLEYKSKWNFKHFEKIDRFAPSSQICSDCGSRQDMPLSVRTFVCKSCGKVIDRDDNASINIRNFSTLGQRETCLDLSEQNAQGDSSLEESLNCEKYLVAC